MSRQDRQPKGGKGTTRTAKGWHIKGEPKEQREKNEATDTRNRARGKETAQGLRGLTDSEVSQEPSMALEEYMVMGARLSAGRRANEAIGKAQAAQPCPPGLRVIFVLTDSVDPPAFTLFTEGEMPASYLQYLEHNLREEFDAEATPLEVRVKRSDD